MIPIIKSPQSSRLIVILFFVFFVLLRMNAFAPYRNLSPDEQWYLHTSLSLLRANHGYIPASEFLSHVRPEFHDVAFHPPLLFLIYASLFRFAPFSSVTIGVLHFLVNFATLWLFYKYVEMSVQKMPERVLLCFAFSLFCWQGQEICRPENVLLFFGIGSCYFAGRGLDAKTPQHFYFAGFCLGLATLTHLGFTFIGWAMCLCVLFASRQLSRTERLAHLKHIFAGWGMVAALWAIWWLPYASENWTVWTQFILPDQSENPFLSLGSRLIWMFAGPYTKNGLLTLNLSFSPLILTLAALPLFCHASPPLRRSVLFCTALVGGSLACVKPILGQFPLLCAFLLIVLPLLMKERQEQKTRIPFGGVLAVLCVQSAVIGGLAAAKVLGDISLYHSLGGVPHAALFQSLPHDTTLLSSEGYSLFRLDPLHQKVYWPAGLSGKTGAGIDYRTDYSSEKFAYALFDKPLDEVTNPGLKFRWDQATVRYFRQNYELVFHTSLPAAPPRLARFSQVPRHLYLYKRKGLQ